jgi:hypothetical protein
VLVAHLVLVVQLVLMARERKALRPGKMGRGVGLRLFQGVGGYIL